MTQLTSLPNSFSHLKNENGFSLIEMMIAAAVAVILMIGVADIFLSMITGPARNNVASGLTVNSQTRQAQVLANPPMFQYSITGQ